MTINLCSLGRRPFLWVVAAGALATASMPAVAHHGWSWAVDEQTELTGKIHAVSMVPPHPSLQVTAEDGVLWQVDLGNPGRTDRSGFTAGTAQPGDAVTVLGNRSRDPDEMLMKAVRITIDGRDYDMYPERIQTN